MGGVGRNCESKEHNVMTWKGLEPRSFDPESSALTTETPYLPLNTMKWLSSSQSVNFYMCLCFDAFALSVL